MKDKPLILVTNDDGITAKGIQTLVAVASRHGKVVVVAPDKPQSGTGHAITVNDTLKLQPFRFFENIEAHMCSGTPVDCVKLAVYEVMHQKPDLIVSGINHGSNASSNVLYSGTMSAAVEGALEGIPSIGFSLMDHSAEADFSACEKYVDQIIIESLKQSIPEGVCLNVNIPKGNAGDIKGIKVCRQARAFWDDRFDKRQDPLGNDYYWLTGEFKDFDGGEDTDVHALRSGYVSIVPTQFDMTAHHSIARINNWNLNER